MSTPILSVNFPRRAAPPRAPTAAPQRVLDVDLRLHGLTLRRLAWTALAVALFTASSTLANAIASDGGWPKWPTLARYAPPFVLQYVLWLFPALLADVVAEQWAGSGVRRGVVMASALLVSAAASVVLLELSGSVCLACGASWTGQTLLYMIQRGIDIAVYCGAVALAWHAYRRDADVTSALRGSEVARAEAERERLASALQTLQARVDPQLLIGALRDVAERCAGERRAAGRLLDNLIDYLRAALPATDERGSTVARECALLQSLLGIAALRSASALDVACDVDGSVRHVSIAPLTLAPLASAIGEPATASGTVRVVASRIDARARVSVEAQGDVATLLAPAGTVSQARERLHAFHGDGAALMVDRRGAQWLRLIVELPA